MTSNQEKSITNTPIGRRSILKSAVGIAGVAAMGSVASAADADYEVIEVPPGETYRVNLSDGETFENVLFDISAQGASAQIRARANDWTIRNVGWVGHWDSTQDSWHPIICDVQDQNSEGLIENVCFETTTEYDGPYGNGPGGPYVFPQHAGHLTFRHVYLQHFQDNGIYASGPGAPHEGGQGGTVEIDTCYAYRCGTSNFRLGSDGSVLRNSVAVDGHRGYWGQFGHTMVEDSHFLDNNNDVAVGDGNPHQSPGRTTIELSNSRWESQTAHGHHSQQYINGSSVDRPENFVPDGVPTTAVEAASGSTQSRDPEEQDPDEPSDDFDLVTFITEPDAEFAEYELIVDGKLVPTEAGYDSPSGNRIAADRESIDVTDGVSSVASLSGGGYGDAYEIYGPVIEVNVDQPNVMWIELNGEQVSEAELIDRTGDEEEDHDEVEDNEYRTLELAGQFEYRIEVDGEIQPAEEHSQWLEEGDAYGDDWAEWWLSGGDNARTVWEFTGEITDLQIDDHDGETEIRTLAVDGEELDHDDFVDTGPSTLEVAGQFRYRVEVDGEIRPSEEHARWVEEGDAYGDDWAEWWLSGGDNARTVWEFTGEITDLQIDDYDGETEIRTLAVDGEEVDHS